VRAHTAYELPVDPRAGAIRPQYRDVRRPVKRCPLPLTHQIVDLGRPCHTHCGVHPAFNDGSRCATFIG
jgi:hypothetical protein